jgi:uncharacterized protein
MEQKIRFETDDGIRLEGLFCEGNNGRGVVIAHPHPLYGGDMYNNVVAIIQQGFRETGCSTLRFNFRGVGASGGAYDEGDGEQRDVKAAIQILRKSGVSLVDLAGYSFGAWVIARTVADVETACDRIVMIAPPVGMLSFPPNLTLPDLSLVVTGSKDPFAPPETLAEHVRLWSPAARLEVIGGADHFFLGFENVLKDVLKKLSGSE